MFTKLIRGLLGLLGIVKKTEVFTTKDNTEFLATRSPGEIILVGPGNSPLSQGIANAEGNPVDGQGGFFSHAALHIGQEWGQKMRQLHPEICNIPGVGNVAAQNEIIEAEGTGIQVDTLAKYTNGNTQLAGFTRNLTDAQLETLFLWAYQQVGKIYGYLTFVTELFPNPSDVPVNDPGYICSGLVATDYRQLSINIVKSGIDSRKADPQDIYDCLEPQLLWGRHFYNMEI